MDSDYFQSPESADATRTQRRCVCWWRRVARGDGGIATGSTVESLTAGRYRPPCRDEDIRPRPAQTEWPACAGSMQRRMCRNRHGAPLVHRGRTSRWCVLHSVFFDRWRSLVQSRLVSPSPIHARAWHVFTLIPQWDPSFRCRSSARIGLGKSQPPPFEEPRYVSFTEFRRRTRRRVENW